MDINQRAAAIAELVETDPDQLKEEAIARALAENPKLTRAQAEGQWAATAAQLGL